MVSGVLLVVLGAAVGGQGRVSGVLSILVGLAFFGYGLYLELLFQVCTYPSLPLRLRGAALADRPNDPRSEGEGTPDTQGRLPAASGELPAVGDVGARHRCVWPTDELKTVTGRSAVD